MIETPFFSVILPTYNRASMVMKAINSVLNQTFVDWQLIVVDDGSTDNTKELVSKIEDDRVVYCYKKNEERSVARNFGIDIAMGRYICFLDSDDGYYNIHLSELHKAIKKNNYASGVYYSGMNQLFPNKVVKTPFYNKEKYEHPFNFVWREHLLINSVCIPSEILEDHRFPEKFNIWEDTHLWLRIVLNYPIYQVFEYTTFRKIHNNSTVYNLYNKTKFKDVVTHMSCIDDFYSKNTIEVSKLIDKDDLVRYKLKSYIRYIDKAIVNKEIILFILLYFYGLMHFKTASYHKMLIKKISRVFL